MGARCGELVAADETTIVSESPLDEIVVEDDQGNGRLPDSPWTDQSDRGEGFYETDDLLDLLLTAETGPRWRGRRLSEYARYKCEVVEPSVVKAADLVWV